MTTNYLPLLKAGEAEIQPFLKRRDDLRDQRTLLREKTAGLHAYIEQAQSDIAGLELQSGDALLKGESVYTAFNSNLQECRAKLQEKRDELQATERAGPLVEKLSERAHYELHCACEGACKRVKAVCEAAMTAHVAQSIEEHDSFLDACDLFANGHGQSYSRAPENIPTLKHERLSKQFRNGVRPLSSEERAARVNQKPPKT